MAKIFKKDINQFNNLLNDYRIHNATSWEGIGENNDFSDFVKYVVEYRQDDIIPIIKELEKLTKESTKGFANLRTIVTIHESKATVLLDLRHSLKDAKTTRLQSTISFTKRTEEEIEKDKENTKQISEAVFKNENITDTSFLITLNNRIKGKEPVKYNIEGIIVIPFLEYIFACLKEKYPKKNNKSKEQKGVVKAPRIIRNGEKPNTHHINEGLYAGGSGISENELEKLIESKSLFRFKNKYGLIQDAIYKYCWELRQSIMAKKTSPVIWVDNDTKDGKILDTIGWVVIEDSWQNFIKQTGAPWCANDIRKDLMSGAFDALGIGKNDEGNPHIVYDSLMTVKLEFEKTPKAAGAEKAHKKREIKVIDDEKTVDKFLQPSKIKIRLNCSFYGTITEANLKNYKGMSNGFDLRPKYLEACLRSVYHYSTTQAKLKAKLEELGVKSKAEKYNPDILRLADYLIDNATSIHNTYPHNGKVCAVHIIDVKQYALENDMWTSDKEYKPARIAKFLLTGLWTIKLAADDHGLNMLNIFDIEKKKGKIVVYLINKTQDELLAIESKPLYTKEKSTL